MFEKNKWYLSHCSYEGNRSRSMRDCEQVHIRLMLGKKTKPEHPPFRSRADSWIDKTTKVPQTVQGTLPQCRHFHQHEVMTATFFLVTTLFYQYYKIRHTLDFAQRQEGLLLQEVVNLGQQVISQWRAPSLCSSHPSSDLLLTPNLSQRHKSGSPAPQYYLCIS